MRRELKVCIESQPLFNTTAQTFHAAIAEKG